MRTTLSKVVCIIAAPPAGGSRSAYHAVLEAVTEVSLSKEQVQHIAMLARLTLNDTDMDDVVAKLSGIVDFVDQLQAAPTDDVMPMAHPLRQTQRLRADEVTESNQRDHIQQNATTVQDGLYLVPRVIE